MILEEIYNGRLLIVGDSLEWHRQLAPRGALYKAYVILQDLYDGTYKVIKNYWGDKEQIIDKKGFTKFLLRVGNDKHPIS
jgi:hypothetical protein